MSIFINYGYTAECSEEDLAARLERLRRKFRKLPFKSVGKVRHLDPAFQNLPLRELKAHGYPLPAAVEERIAGLSREHIELCHWVAPPALIEVPDKVQAGFFKPAVKFSKETDLWRESDVPAKLQVGFCLTYYRLAFTLEFANVMLRHGYLLMVDPGAGCESFCVGLTSYRTVNPPLWLGSGFTKTLYAERLVEAHEGICRALDLIKDEGLLLGASDTCEYYERRDWSRSGKIVNGASTFVGIVHSLLDVGIEAARKSGVKIEDVSDPATKHRNFIRTEKKAKRKRAENGKA